MVHSDLMFPSDHEKEPTIFLAATDGCFNFCLSPAHFEHAILTALRNAESVLEWRNVLLQNLERQAGDDLSLALIAAGWDSFRSLRDAFAQRLEVLSVHFVAQLDELDAQVNHAAELHKQLISERNRVRSDVWTQYRQNYELFRKNSQVPR